MHEFSQKMLLISWDWTLTPGMFQKNLKVVQQVLSSRSDSLHRCYSVDVKLTLSVGPHCSCGSFCPGRRGAFLEVNVHQYLTWFNPPGCRGSGCGTMNQGLPFKRSWYGNLGSAHQEPLLLEKGGQTLAAECCGVAAGGMSQCLWTVFLGSIWEPWVWGREGQWAPRCAGGGGLDVKKRQGSSLRRWKEGEGAEERASTWARTVAEGGWKPWVGLSRGPESSSFPVAKWPVDVCWLLLWWLSWM